MKVESISFPNLSSIQTKLTEIKESNFNPTIAICFCCPKMEIEVICQTFKEHQIQMIGCTSSGEICDGNIYKKSITCLLMELPVDAFEVVYCKGVGKDYFSNGAQIGSTAKEKFKNPGILIYSGGIGIDGESIVKGIKSQFEHEIPVYGGMGGDNLKFENVYVFSHEIYENNGLVALIIDTDKIRMSGLSYSGWNELGKMHKVTKANGNNLLEIDGKPALDLFNHYFGNIDYTSEQGKEGLRSIPAIYPLKIKSGVELMRSIVMYNVNDKSLILGGAIKEGENFKFCPTPSFGVIDKTVKAFEQLSKVIGTVDAILMNSCVGRHIAFGPMMEEEVEGCYNIWNKPMIGYMANGEFGNTGENQACEFHNVTCSLVTLTEL